MIQYDEIDGEFSIAKSNLNVSSYDLSITYLKANTKYIKFERENIYEFQTSTFGFPYQRSN